MCSTGIANGTERNDLTGGNFAHSDDALPAAQLARALDRGKVYFLSRLEASVVEDLEMIHVGNGAELARLARRHASCILLSNAQYAVTKPARS